MCENDIKGVERSLNSLIVTHVKLKESKVVFVALTQHCIQSNATYVERVKSVLCIEWPVHHWSVRGGSFVKFLGLVNYKGDCRQEPQPIPNS